MAGHRLSDSLLIRAVKNGGGMFFTQVDFWGYGRIAKSARKSGVLSFRITDGRGAFDGCKLINVRATRKGKARYKIITKAGA